MKKGNSVVLAYPLYGAIFGAEFDRITSDHNSRSVQVSFKNQDSGDFYKRVKDIPGVFFVHQLTSASSRDSANAQVAERLGFPDVWEVSILSDADRNIIAAQMKKKFPEAHVRTYDREGNTAEFTGDTVKANLSVEFWYAIQDNQKTLDAIRDIEGVVAADYVDAKTEDYGVTALHARIEVEKPYETRVIEQIKPLPRVWSVQPA